MVGLDHPPPLNGLVLLEEFSQSLSPCGPKIVALGEKQAVSHSLTGSEFPPMPQGPWSARGQGWGALCREVQPPSAPGLPAFRGLPRAGLFADMNSCSGDGHTQEAIREQPGDSQTVSNHLPRPPAPDTWHLPPLLLPGVAHSDTQERRSLTFKSRKRSTVLAHRPRSSSVAPV